jgi:tRNA G10  N-methylase Trm11
MENTTPAGVVLCGDALKILPTLDPQSVDCCITDPPYGETSLDWDRAVNWLDLVRPLLKPARVGLVLYLAPASARR